MKKSIPIIRERESEAFILGNGRERVFPLTPVSRFICVQETFSFQKRIFKGCTKRNDHDYILQHRLAVATNSAQINHQRPQTDQYYGRSAMCSVIYMCANVSVVPRVLSAHCPVCVCASCQRFYIGKLQYIILSSNVLPLIIVTGSKSQLCCQKMQKCRKQFYQLQLPYLSVPDLA